MSFRNVVLITVGSKPRIITETIKKYFSHGKFVADGECNSWQLSTGSGYFLR